MIIVITIIISTSSISISIYFVVLLNCLYLNLRVFPFIHFSCWGGTGGVSERLSGPSCRLPG